MMKSGNESMWASVVVQQQVVSTRDLLPAWPLLKAKGPSSYTSASRSSIDVLEAKRPLCCLQEGREVSMNLKVLDPLQSALFAVSELVQSCRVVFDFEKNMEDHI